MICPVCEQEMKQSMSELTHFYCINHNCVMNLIYFHKFETKVLKTAIKSSKTVERLEETIYNLRKDMNL